MWNIILLFIREDFSVIDLVFPIFVSNNVFPRVLVSPPFVNFFGLMIFFSMLQIIVGCSGASIAGMTTFIVMLLHANFF